MHRMYYPNGTMGPWTDDNEEESDEPDRDDPAESCVDSIRDSIPYWKRRQLANTLGSNWACIISGCGDQ